MCRLRRRGFSLIEVIIAVSILVILAGIAIPVVGSQLQKAKASNILSLVETLRTACDLYRGDTGQYATEYSGATYASAGYHRLAIPQNSLTGWDGPYIDHPLSEGDNPFESNCYLYPNLTGGSIQPNGFDLMGSGTATHTGDGNFIGFSDVPQTVAEIVDDALDKNIAGDWRATGRVEYIGTNLAIYLVGGI